MTYRINSSIELSKDLTRYARKGGQDSDPKWTLGTCKIEFLKQQGSWYVAEPAFLDPKEAVERITIDSEVDLTGDFGLQCVDLNYAQSEQAKIDWLADKEIEALDDRALKAMIGADLTFNRQPFTPENAELAKQRLKDLANTPKADRLTVRAVISHSGVLAVREQHNQCIADLATQAGISKNEAIWLANCHNDKGIIFEESCWCTSGAKFFVEPKEHDLNELVKKGLMQFEKTGTNDRKEDAYTTTDLGRRHVESAYL